MLKLLKYLKPYFWQILLVCGLVCGQVICELSLPNMMSKIIDQGIPQGDFGFILKTGGLMLALTLGATSCVVLSNYFCSKISMGYGAILRSKMFRKVQTFSVEEMNRVGTSSLITRTTNDVVQIQGMVYMVLRMFLMAPLMMLGGIIFSVSMNAKFSFVLMFSIPAIIIIICVVGAFVMPLFKSMQKKMDALTVVSREGLTGVRVIRAFNQEGRERKRYASANRDVTHTAIKANRWMSIMMPGIMLVMNITTVAIIWLGAGLVNEGAVMAGEVSAIMQYSMQIMFGLVTVAMLFIMIPRASASGQRINQVLSIEPAIEDGGVQTETKAHGLVEFDSVTFSFPGAEEPTLYDVSFVSKPGETTALIGSTGSGKSTIINLIPRFFDVQSGSVKVDGVDVREMPAAELRQKIGFVPQKSMLFSGTIAGNIRHGKPDATDEEVKKAAEIAQAGDFIESLEKGYDSHVAQGGTNYSGGQRQRLCIARALVRKPEIYIFDDSFSALDFKTDKKLRQALKPETKDATVLIVAQRVSTIMDADRIIVLEEGKVVGEGTHKELLANNAVYREIVLSQLEEEEA